MVPYFSWHGARLSANATAHAVLVVSFRLGADKKACTLDRVFWGYDSFLSGVTRNFMKIRYAGR